MLKKTMTYTDYDGNTRTEDFYFNLSKAEVMEMEMGTNGGLANMMQKIVAEQDSAKIIEYFKMFILKSYGIKSLDGKRFEKSKEISEEFAQTEAYSDLFMELVSDPDYAAKFFNGIIPQNVGAAAESMPAPAPALTPVN